MSLHDDGLVSAGELAQKLGISRRSLRRLVRVGTLAAPANAELERFDLANFATELGYTPAQRAANGISDSDPASPDSQE